MVGMDLGANNAIETVTTSRGFLFVSFMICDPRPWERIFWGSLHLLACHP